MNAPVDTALHDATYEQIRAFYKYFDEKTYTSLAQSKVPGSRKGEIEDHIALTVFLEYGAKLQVKIKKDDDPIFRKIVALKEPNKEALLNLLSSQK